MAGNSPFASPPRPVTNSEIGNAVWDFVKKSAYHLAGFLKRHGGPIFIALVTVSLAFLLYAEIQRRSTREMALLTGPWGGVYRDRGTAIAREMDRRNVPLFGSRYRLVARASNGFVDNHRLILQDDKGTTAGFITDGFGTPDDITKLGVLVPFEDNVLHMFCSLKFLNQLTEPQEGAEPVLKAEQVHSGVVTLAMLAPQIAKQRGRVYLGPDGSGTRQAAELVLRQHGLGHLTESTHGVSNFEEMRAALLTGHVVLAFYCGPLNAPIVRDIAADGSCRLIGLNGSRQGAMAQVRGFGEFTIAKDTHRTGSFCPIEIETVQTRTVLACPMTMSDADAYAITRAASAAMRGYTMPAWRAGAMDGWSRSSDKLKFDLHPAAEMFLRGAPPTTPLTTLHFTLSTFGVWLLVEILKWMTARIPDRSASQPSAGLAEPTPQAPPPTNGAPTAYETISERLDGLLNESRELDLDGPQTAEKCREWSRAAIELRREIFVQFRRDELTPSQRDTLLELVNQLREEVAWIREQHDNPRLQTVSEGIDPPITNGAALDGE